MARQDVVSRGARSDARCGGEVSCGAASASARVTSPLAARSPEGKISDLSARLAGGGRADGLQRLESAVKSVRLEQAKKNYRRLLADETDIDARVEELHDAILDLDIGSITREAIKAGLTTPGQDLSAGQGKGWAANVG